MVIQLLQKLPSLRHLELIGVTNAAIPTLSACKPPAALRILKLSGFPSSYFAPSRLERIEYTPLLRSEGWRSLKLEKISLVAAFFTGTTVNEFKMLVSSTTACDITFCVVAHAVELAVASERDPAVSYGITDYRLPGISNPAERDTLSISVPMYAPTPAMLQAQIQQQQQQPGSRRLLWQAMFLSNTAPFHRLFREIGLISPAVISRIAQIELSGLALNALLSSQLTLPVVKALRLVITCERDGYECFRNNRDPDTTVDVQSAVMSLPHLRTLHVECAQYLFAVPNLPSTTPQPIQPLSYNNMILLQAQQLRMQAQARLMLESGYPSSAHSIPAAPVLSLEQLEERSRRRAHVLERWFVHLLPGLVRGYDRALDTITVRLPSWKGFESAAEEFDTLFAGLALNRAVVREPDGVLYEDPHSVLRGQWLSHTEVL
ncbi:hypothetical protein BKA62DRAFT_708132 [Auriculariales sp. MPI-PUGE-AT-0066]|nr:hypothetical protein BKA62DRAFT_708132 [Auriculariales sp. MPI-PUGE-AT-0066]